MMSNRLSYATFLFLVSLNLRAFAFITQTKTCGQSSAATVKLCMARDAFTNYKQNNAQKDIIYKDTVVGSGDVAENGKVVSVAYTARLMENDQTFESADFYGFELGTGAVIPGWEKGLTGMKAGGKRIIRIPPRLAYGKEGLGRIPPNAHLEFEFELRGVASNPIEEAFMNLSMSPLRLGGILFFFSILALNPQFE
mmetsp:Transcript_30127/g.45937  ORF Transcript_30127/g.45937 Transcript_30127/m.45937 type:complete len:196 (-) Transcript_30127:86-673(-)